MALPLERTQQINRLTRLRTVATSIFLALTVVFIGTHFVGDDAGWVLFIRAVTEAGMIGGLADWFAVEAIFRHPLRIPIPHTALLRNNKDQAADSIGKFIEDYILVPEQIGSNILAVRPSTMIAQWLCDQKNSSYVASLLVDGLRTTLTTDQNSIYRQEIRSLIVRLVNQKQASPAVSALVTEIVQKGVMGHGFSQVLQQISDLLDTRREAIYAIVQENSRWWVASTVDHKVAGVIVDAIISFLAELADPKSEIHGQFETVFTEFVDKLNETGALSAVLEGDEGALALSNRLVDAGFEMMGAVLNDADKGSSPVTVNLAVALRNIAQHLLNDQVAARALDEKLKTISVATLTKNRSLIGRYVAKTLKAWNTDMLIDRFEAELGPDLQYVRINGTVLGGIIGGLIFAVETLLP